MATKLELAVARALAGPDEPMSGEVVENILLTGILDAVAGSGSSGSIFRGTPVMDIGSIAATDTPEDIAAEDLTRSYLEVINTSASGTFWINFGADADNTAAVCIPVVAGGSWSSPPNWCPTGRVSIAGTASDTYSIITA